MNEMHPFMHNTFWVENEVSFTFVSSHEAAANDPGKSVNIDDLAAFLKDQGYMLPSMDETVSPDQMFSLPGPSYTVHQGLKTEDLSSSSETIVTAFLPFDEMQHPPMTMPTMASATADLSTNAVARLVNLVNEHLPMLQSGQVRLSNGRLLGAVPIIAAAPNWNCGASNDDPGSHVTTGCPLTPPIPLAEDQMCVSAPGRWPIQLPDLPMDLKRTSGADVTVFVLDTLPKRADIRRAAEVAGEHNLLLDDLLSNARFHYPKLPDVLVEPGPNLVKTGRDIMGRVVGFHMPDHGLFVAGIIHDIAPDATIECVRVLNDYCAGTVQVLMEQLQQILLRTEPGHDLHGKDVVINMSLVIPDDDDVQTSGIDVGIARTGLLLILQKLAEQGVIFTSSAGNEGDNRYMKPAKPHPDALYPAAFAYAPPNDPGRVVSTMIPVGAVNYKGQASSYSCYPGPKGISTYGGETPDAYAIVENSNTHMTEVDCHQIDALIGLSTQLFYPALSFDDPEPSYPSPNAHGWSYWAGTSFSTPIICAVMARMLELRRSNPMKFANLQLEDMLSYMSQGHTLPWQLSTDDNSLPVFGPVIHARQLQPFERRYEHPSGPPPEMSHM